MTLLLIIAAAFAFFQGSPDQAFDLGFIVVAGTTAATPTQYLTSFFKNGLPAAPGWGVQLFAICAGQLATFLIAAAMGQDFTGVVVARAVLAGIFATAAAAGANKSDRAAEEKRDAAKAARAEAGPEAEYER